MNRETMRVGHMSIGHALEREGWNGRGAEIMKPGWIPTVLMILSLGMWSQPVLGRADHSTHEADHREDEDIQVLGTVHVHGLKLNKDQQLGPVPTHTPWPTMPTALQGQEVDDWMKVRILVSKTGKPTVVVLEPAKHRQLNLAGLQALKQWTFDPRMEGDDPVDGELTVRIHFRTR